MEEAGGANTTPDSVTRALRAGFLGVLLPAWFLPGLLDWYWHRVTHIENNAGPRESLTHALMMTEAGVPVFLALFFQVDAGIIALAIVSTLLHEATAIWDVAYATPRRKIAPREQHTHTFLESLPVMTLAALTLLHPEQAAALFGRGPQRPRFRLRRKRPPLPGWYVGTMLAATAAFVALPYGEEFVRCWRKQSTLARTPIPPEPPVTAAHRWAREHHAEGWES